MLTSTRFRTLLDFERAGRVTSEYGRVERIPVGAAVIALPDVCSGDLHPAERGVHRVGEAANSAVLDVVDSDLRIVGVPDRNPSQNSRTRRSSPVRVLVVVMSSPLHDAGSAHQHIRQPTRTIEVPKYFLKECRICTAIALRSRSSAQPPRRNDHRLALREVPGGLELADKIRPLFPRPPLRPPGSPLGGFHWRTDTARQKSSMYPI